MSVEDDDAEEFRNAMRDVRRLDVEARAAGPRPRKRPRPAERPSLDKQPDLGVRALEMGEEMSFRRAGVNDRTFRQLRRGRFSIEAELDLHGLTLEPARQELRSCIVKAAADGLGCVRVIHGRGLRSGDRGPVLKESVNTWLRHWEEVLAFSTARARDGGSGAIYVLLRRRS